MTDWGAGRYELTADRLAPAAEEAVRALAPQPGERVLDVACGTGNAALVAARAGASAVGVDSAARLVGVARERAAAEGLDATFAVADATDVGFGDGAFDAAVSVFGVIFAEAGAAARELVRVVRPGGRIVLTTWTTEGATPRALAAMREALGAPSPPVTWSDPEFVRRLFSEHDVTIERRALAFTADSVEAYMAEQEHHPMTLAVLPKLRERGLADEVAARMTAVYAEENEDPSAFRTTSHYHLITVRPR